MDLQKSHDGININHNLSPFGGFRMKNKLDNISKSHPNNDKLIRVIILKKTLFL